MVLEEDKGGYFTVDDASSIKECSHIQHFFCSFGQDIDVVDVCSLQSQRVQFIAHCRDIEDKGKSEHLLLFLIFTIFTTTARQLSFFIQ